MYETILVSKQKYLNLIDKKFGDDFICKGFKYRISSWGTDEVTAIRIDRLGGKSINDTTYKFVISKGLLWKIVLIIMIVVRVVLVIVVVVTVTLAIAVRLAKI